MAIAAAKAVYRTFENTILMDAGNILVDNDNANNSFILKIVEADFIVVILSFLLIFSLNFIKFFVYYCFK